MEEGMNKDELQALQSVSEKATKLTLFFDEVFRTLNEDSDEYKHLYQTAVNYGFSPKVTTK